MKYEKEFTMARHGITYEDVLSAANSLKCEDKSVTIENVRRFLGTGSAGTVNQHLRRWKEAQNSTQKIASKENLPERLISLVKGLWEGVLEQSTEQFTPIETNYQQEISELKVELEKYRDNNQRWQKMFNQWQQEKIVLTNEKLTLEQALEFAHKENQSLHGKHDSLLQQLQEKQERIEELHRLHQQTQANLEHYRESARQQRLLDQQQHEQQKQQLQLEIKILNEQLIIQREKSLEIQQQHQTLQQLFSMLEKNHTEVQSQFQQLIVELEETKNSKNKHLQDSEHWQNQYKDSYNLLSNKTNQLIDAQAEAKLLAQKLIDAKQSFVGIQKQNKLLGQEKWELAQEKAQLEGQLKQLQRLVS